MQQMRVGQRYQLLYDIAHKLNSDKLSEEVLCTIVKTLCQAAKAKGCSLMLLTTDGTQLIHTVAHGLSDWYMRKGPVVVDENIAQALQGKPMAVLDATTDHRIQYREQAKREGIVSMLSLPLMRRGHIIGIIRIYSSKPRKFTIREIDFFGALADLGAIALERAEMHESVDRDLSRCIIERSNLEEDKKRFLSFFSMAAHDLKAPLAAIQSFLRVMLDGYTGTLNDKQKHMIERSSIRITELLRLISDLLDIPRIEMGQIVQELQSISIESIINNFAEEATSLAKQKGIEFTVELSHKLPKVNGSAPRLQQVIVNLVNNAINYTKAGEVRIQAKKSHGHIMVCVLDTGCGIPENELSHVFEDFFRGSNTEVRGTGLGLSISKRIIEAHSGKIWIESPNPDTGTGSKFCFTIPLRK